MLSNGMYTITLECDCGLCDGQQTEFTGQTRRECLKQARDEGWVIAPKRNHLQRCYSPDCGITRHAPGTAHNPQRKRHDTQQ